MSAGEALKNTVANQANMENTRALVHNLLTQDQGTSANEALHFKAKHAMRSHGGTRSFQTLQAILSCVAFHANGTALLILFADQSLRAHTNLFAAKGNKLHERVYRRKRDQVRAQE